MKKGIRGLSIVLSVLIILSSISIAGIGTFAADSVNEFPVVFEAENSLGATNTRTVTSTGIECDPATNVAGIALQGSDYSLTPGTYKVTAVMKVMSRLDENDRNYFAELKVDYKIRGASESSYNYAIRDASFTALNTLQNLDFYFRVTSPITNVNLIINSINKVKFGVDKLILEKMPDETPMVVQAEYDRGKLTGRFTNEGILCEKDKHAVNYMISGAVMTLDPGKYTVNVYAKVLAKAANADDDVFMFDMYYKDAETNAKLTGFAQTFKQKDFPDAVGQYKKFKVEVEVPAGKRYVGVQMRTQFKNTADVLIDKIEIAPEFPLVFEAEASTAADNTRVITEDGIECDPARDMAGVALQGSDYILDPGTYKVTAVMKVMSRDLDAKTLFGDFIVEYKINGTPESSYNYGLRDVTFKELDTWQNLEFYFRVTTQVINVNLKINSRDIVKFGVDKLILEKLDLDAPMVVQAENDRGNRTGTFTDEGVKCQKDIHKVDYMVSGCYITLDPGKYTVNIYAKQLAKAAGNSEDIFMFDMAYKYNSANLVGFSRAFKQSDFPDTVGQYKKFSVEVIVPEGQRFVGVQLRAQYKKTSDILIDKFEVVPSNFPVVYEAETSIGANNTRTVTAEGIECDPATNVAGIALQGSDYDLEPGTYKVTAVMKVMSRAANPNTLFGELKVDYKIGGVAESSYNFGIRDITFDALNTWQNLDFYFRVTSPVTNVNLIVNSKDTVKFGVDKLILDKMSDESPLVVQAEYARGSNTGTFTNEGIKCEKGNKVDYMVSDAYITLDSGVYTVDVYAKQLDKAANATDDIFMFDMGYKLNGAKLTGFSKTFKQSAFPETLGVYRKFSVDVEVPEGERFVGVQFRAQFKNNSGIVIDRFEVTPNASTGGPLFEVEAERMNSVIGVKTDNGVVCTVGMGSNFALYGTNVKIPPGSWKAVVYMKINEKTGDGDTVVSIFDLNCKPGGAERQQLYPTDVTESQFEQTDTYYAIVIPFINDIELLSTELRMLYTNKVDLKYDKMMILKIDDEVPEPIQEEEEVYERPDGVPAHDKYDVPITPENIEFSSTKSGKITNNAIEFRIEEHNVGDVKSIKNPFYLTNGRKYARFYLRTPNDIAGTFTFLNFTVFNENKLIGDVSLKGDDLTGYANKPYIISMPFDANEHMAINFKISWKGNYDIIIDKIEFTDSTETSNIYHPFKMEADGSKKSVNLTAADMEGISAIDYLKINKDGIYFVIPAAYVFEWLNKHESIDFSSGNIDTQKSARFSEITDNYSAKIDKLSEFTFTVTLNSTSNNITLDVMPNYYDVLVPAVEGTITKDNYANFEVISLFMQESGRLNVLRSVITEELDFISFNTKNLGTFYSGIADLTKLKAEEPEEPEDPTDPDPKTPSKPGKSPGTGDSMLLFEIVIATFACIVLVFIKKYRKAS